MKLQKLITNVQRWSIDRGLDKADSKKQMLKLYEEFGELASGLAKGNKEVVKDSIYETDHQIGHHTRNELEKAGFGEVFNSPLFEVEEVEE